MAESVGFQAVQSENPRPSGEESEEEDDDDEDQHKCSGEFQGGLAESRRGGESASSVATGGAELGEAQLETLAANSAVGESDQSAGLQVNSGVEERGVEEIEEQVGVSDQEVLATVVAQAPEGQIQNQLQVAVSPISSSEVSPTCVTQPISSAPGPMVVEQKASPQKLTISMPETEKLNPSELTPISAVTIVKTPTSDGFNWRKYGQKLVKSPKGSRSYYKCTYSECCAKRVECCDHSGLVIEMVYKGEHNHDPPRKVSCTRENRLLSPTQPVASNSIVEQPVKTIKGSDPSTSSIEPVRETTSAAERKRPNSSDSDGNDGIAVKEENVNQPEPKRRVKKGNLACSGTVLKPGKKPKFVVHAAGDVGISGDGYRWRKYGQKMVKGNPNPRNYYRCTSAGCPVRKHIETAVDNTSAVIITYKGIHDHDMPVPKKRHGPPSAPLVAATAPASMNSLQAKQNQISSTRWSVNKGGELTSETLDLGGDKAMESARTLLSIGFEIKPC